MHSLKLQYDIAQLKAKGMVFELSKGMVFELLWSTFVMF